MLAGAAGITEQCGLSSAHAMPGSFEWDSQYLCFTVREPYPSTSTGTDIVFGRIEKGAFLQVSSSMSENGVIFSDGVEQDFIEFNSGAIARIGLSERYGNLIV